MFFLVSSKYGQKLPSSSKTEVQRTSSIPAALPSFSIILSGPQEYSISTPSCWACSISHGFAGISSRLSRQASVTSLAPKRTAVRATSTATLPPPMTTTRSFTATSPPSATSDRNSTPQCTLPSADPSSSILRLNWAPTATNTALKPSCWS